MSKRLHIVTDMLNDFCHENGVLARSLVTGEIYAEDIIPAYKAVIEDARKKGDPIIWICDAHDEDDIEFKRFPKHAVKDTWGAQIIDEFDPELIKKAPNELIILKTRYSGFYNTELEFKVAQIDPDETIVGGVCTSICVMDTVGGLANRDYNVTVPRAIVADFDPASHEAALARMEGLYGATIL